MNNTKIYNINDIINEIEEEIKFDNLGVVRRLQLLGYGIDDFYEESIYRYYVRKFQYDNNIRVTGVMDSKTYMLLLNNYKSNFNL